MGPLLKVGTHSPDDPLPVSSGNMFWGSTVSERGDAEKSPNPSEPLSGTPKAQIGGWEMIFLCDPNTAPVFV